MRSVTLFSVLTLAAGLALAVGSCGGGSAAPPASPFLAGVVTRFDTGAPVSGVEVSLDTGVSTTTDASGAYAFTDVGDEAPESVRFSASGYRSRTVALETGQSQLDTTLTWIGAGSVIGFIVDPEGLPVVGARVEVSGEPRSATTNQAGYYFLYEAPGGLQVLSIGALGYATQAATITVRNGEEIASNFMLDRSNARSSLSGLITNALTSRPIVAATVFLGARRAVSDQDGVYTFFELDLGEVTPVYTAAGYRQASPADPITIGEGANTYNVQLLPDDYIEPPPPY